MLEAMSHALPPVCVELPQATRICYVRSDSVGPPASRCEPPNRGEVPLPWIEALTQECLPCRPAQANSLVEKLLPVFPKFVGARDVAVLNFGLHHGADIETAVRYFTNYLAAHRGALPSRTLWQQTAPQHFKNKAGSGDYAWGKPPFECAPLPDIRIEVRAGRPGEGWKGVEGMEAGGGGGRRGCPFQASGRQTPGRRGGYRATGRWCLRGASRRSGSS